MVATSPNSEHTVKFPRPNSAKSDFVRHQNIMPIINFPKLKNYENKRI